MNRNYSNVDKRIWTDKWIHEHHAFDKNNAGYVNVEPFPSGVIEVEKMCRRVTMCKCSKSCNKTTYFCLKTKLNR